MQNKVLWNMCIHDVLFFGRDYTDAVASILLCVSPSNALNTGFPNPSFATHTVIWKGTTTVHIGDPSGKLTFIFLVGGCSIQTFKPLAVVVFSPTSRTVAFIFATTKTSTTLLLAVVVDVVICVQFVHRHPVQVEQIGFVLDGLVCGTNVHKFRVSCNKRLLCRRRGRSVP